MARSYFGNKVRIAAGRDTRISSVFTTEALIMRKYLFPLFLALLPVAVDVLLYLHPQPLPPAAPLYAGHVWHG